ncbi:MAG: hypothetical protein KGJ32_00285 [Xanthomonadaceae bacterium]|nr:hypothetical protein [Xanthomonadaceae bacterium]
MIVLPLCELHVKTADQGAKTSGKVFILDRTLIRVACRQSKIGTLCSVQAGRGWQKVAVSSSGNILTFRLNCG